MNLIKDVKYLYIINFDVEENTGLWKDLSWFLNAELILWKKLSDSKYSMDSMHPLQNNHGIFP